MRDRGMTGRFVRWGVPALILCALAFIFVSSEAASPPTSPEVTSEAAAFSEAAAATQAPREIAPFLRGMTVSCPRSGQIWGSSAMAKALDELHELGVEWVSIHPYARIERDGSVKHRPAADTGYLERAVSIANKRQTSLFWKPHLAYWGNYQWRGEIDFGDDEAAWRRFFADYQTFIVDQAAFAARSNVPLFAVGTELEATVQREREWRQVIAAVRAVYPGRITYAANWDGVDKVPFWDAVDFIGVQAYFPLSEQPAPSQAALEAAWDQHLEALTTLSDKHGGKQVLFTEIGYNPSPDAARQPWDYAVSNTAEARALRARLLDVAIQKAEASPVVAGMFWWKWMPGSSPGRSNFSMRDPEPREALARRWGRPALAR